MNLIKDWLKDWLEHHDGYDHTLYQCGILVELGCILDGEENTSQPGLFHSAGLWPSMGSISSISSWMLDSRERSCFLIFSRNRRNYLWFFDIPMLS